MKSTVITLALMLCAGAGLSRAQSVDGPGDDIVCSGYVTMPLRTADDYHGVISTRTFLQPVLFPPVTGKPYSARRVIQDLQVRADGARLCSAPAVTIQYRDSTGRTREETGFALKGPDGKPAPALIRIVNPVEEIEYDLDMGAQVAYRLHTKKPEPPGVGHVPTPPDPAIQSRRVSLGTHSFQGVEVEGTLTTTTGTPPGSTVAISSTQELWRWPYLWQDVLNKSVNPTGNHTDAYLQLSSAEPDPALFRVPEGWKIVDGVIRPSTGGGGAFRTTSGFQYTTRFSPPTRSDMVIHEAPFSAQQITESATNLALPVGKSFTSSTTFYRDSSGRTRTERPLPAASGDKEPPPVLPEITDPVDNVRIVLDPVHRVAHRFILPEPSGNSPPQVAPASSNRHSTESEKDLGEKTIDGLKVTGTLETFHTPAGANGNDRDLTETSESWFSPGLSLLVLTKQNMATQSSTVRLTNVITAEPDPALFKIPDGYTVVDEKNTVAITITQP